jgi:hypothetical protein
MESRGWRTSSGDQTDSGSGLRGATEYAYAKMLSRTYATLRSKQQSRACRSSFFRGRVRARERACRRHEVLSLRTHGGVPPRPEDRAERLRLLPIRRGWSGRDRHLRGRRSPTAGSAECDRNTWGQLKKGKFTYAKDSEWWLWAFVGV